jgi:hypothetical protein
MDKQTLKLIKLGAKVYNQQRLCRDFQEEEVLKFVEWLYKEWGYIYHDNGTN